MKSVLASVLAILMLLVPASSEAKKPAKPLDCASIPKLLVGAWVIAGPGFFQEMSFEQGDDGNVFSSWLHHRPEMYGQWTLSGCKLRIYDPRGGDTLEFNYTIQSITPRRLKWVDDDGELGVYKRFGR